jgi:hypothetical protein
MTSTEADRPEYRADSSPNSKGKDVQALVDMPKHDKLDIIIAELDSRSAEEQHANSRK